MFTGNVKTANSFCNWFQSGLPSSPVSMSSISAATASGETEMPMLLSAAAADTSIYDTVASMSGSAHANTVGFIRS